MPSITFTDLITSVPASWLNDVNTTIFTALGAATTVGGVRSNLGLTGSAGSSLIGFLQTGTGAVARTIESRLKDTVSAKDFGAVGDGTTDDTAALQAAINYCTGSWASGTTKPALYLPAGTYKITSSLTVTDYVLHMFGAGRFSSIIKFNGVGTGCIKTSAITYFNPNFHDFGISGDAASGKGMDFFNVISQVFNGQIARVDIACGGDGIYAPNLFSFAFDDINVNSSGGHCFRVACGPSVSWRNCYAATAGTGKAGYRLAGCIRMYSCNGVNVADYWGVFGSQLDGSGGTGAWASDFSSTDYPDIELHGCNCESYGNGAVWVVSPAGRLKFSGGKMDRSGLATAYHSDVRMSQNPLSAGTAVVFEGMRVFLGAGVPSGAHLYSDAACPFLEHLSQYWAAAGVTTFKLNGATNYKLITEIITDGELTQDHAYRHTALNPRRISAELLRFKELIPATGTTAPDVTGITLVRTANTGATSIDRFTYTASAGNSNDFGRNGFLIIQVEDVNTTLTHGTAVANGIRLKDRVSYLASKGDVFFFVQATQDLDGTTRTVWMEVARTSRQYRQFGVQGASFAAANNLVLGTDGNYFQITGATQINLIDNTGWTGGSRVTLKFNSNPVVKHNQAASGNNKPIILNGAVDLASAASNTLTLIYDSTDSAWYEIGRKV